MISIIDGSYRTSLNLERCILNLSVKGIYYVLPRVAGGEFRYIPSWKDVVASNPIGPLH